MPASGDPLPERNPPLIADNPDATRQPEPVETTPDTTDVSATVPAAGTTDDPASAPMTPDDIKTAAELPLDTDDNTPAPDDQTEPAKAPAEPPPGPKPKDDDPAPQGQAEPPPARPRRVYMVRCQDDKLNRPLEECLSNWGFAITPIPGDYSEAALDELLRQDPQIGFAVVPLSRDEFHYAKDAKPATALLQSSPDVIFKLGFLCGRLGKTNCFVLYQEQKSYTLPTALINVLFTVMDPHRHWQDILRDRLRHAGLAPVEGSA